jgi:hypothetical protein
MDRADLLPDGCPPAGHQASEGTFYRLAEPRHQPGDKTGLESWVLPVNNPKSKACFGQKACCSCFGFSLFGSVEVLHDARKILRWARKKSIARVDLLPSMGRILETHSDVGPTHFDWWPSPSDLVPHQGPGKVTGDTAVVT